MTTIICEECNQPIESDNILLIEDEDGKDVIICKPCMVSIIESFSDSSDEE